MEPFRDPDTAAGHGPEAVIIMTEETEDTCLDCGAVIPEGTDRCPGCNMQLVFCFSADCGKPYPGELKFCPFCQTPNEMAGPLAAEPEASGAREEGAAAAEGRAAGGAAAPTPGKPSRTTDPAEPVAEAGADEEPFGLVDPETQAALLAALDARDKTSLAPEAMATELAPSGPPSIPAEAVSVGGFAPIGVDIETGQPPRRGRQSLLRLRATNQGLPEEATVEIVAESGLWAAPVALTTRLAPGETHEFSGVRFVPRVAGSDEVRIMITLKNSSNLPIGRWSASQVVNIEDVPTDQGGSIRASGDVIIVGGAPSPLGGTESLPGLPAMSGMMAT